MSFKIQHNDVHKKFKNVLYIAAFTTSSARLRLYDILEKLGERVLYSEMDSAVLINDTHAQSVMQHMGK